MRANEAVRATETLLDLFYEASETAQAEMCKGLRTMLGEIRGRLTTPEELASYEAYLALPIVDYDLKQIEYIYMGQLLPPVEGRRRSKI